MTCRGEEGGADLSARMVFNLFSALNPEIPVD